MPPGPEPGSPAAAGSLSTRAAGSYFTLAATLLVQSAVSAAVLAPTVAAPRLLAQLALPNVAIGVYVAIVYFAAMLSSQWGAALVRRWGPIRTSQCSLDMVAREVPHDSVAAATAGCLFFTFLGVVIGPPLFGGLATLAGSLSAAFAWLALPLLATIVLMLRAGRPRGLP